MHPNYKSLIMYCYVRARHAEAPKVEHLLSRMKGHISCSTANAINCCRSKYHEDFDSAIAHIKEKLTQKMPPSNNSSDGHITNSGNDDQKAFQMNEPYGYQGWGHHMWNSYHGRGNGFQDVRPHGKVHFNWNHQQDVTQCPAINGRVRACGCGRSQNSWNSWHLSLNPADTFIHWNNGQDGHSHGMDIYASTKNWNVHH